MALGAEMDGPIKFEVHEKEVFSSKLVSIKDSKIIDILVSVVSYVAVFITATMATRKERKGSYDVRRMAKTLTDNILNFKYTTIEKATGS
ncbi:cysteine-rich receptor-like protein kinase 2 [Artemisia annua]|uniref:Cysteine-rich receptor-like protein kinase 2 n=1 Tax=Artemisia annua TaxID=35608 RepID=A0A2U1M7P5_ARTAN|nr:cysteine-rich receptor-like protein kinase 2 [Artemisia annua]